MQNKDIEFASSIHSILNFQNKNEKREKKKKEKKVKEKVFDFEQKQTMHVLMIK